MYSILRYTSNGTIRAIKTILREQTESNWLMG